MKILEATPDPTKAGTWKGTALADMPLIGMSEKVSSVITFEQLFVNDKNCVVDGNMDMQIDINLLPPSITSKIKDVETLLAKTIDSLGTLTTKAQGVVDQGIDATNEALDYFQGGGDKGMPTTGSAGATPVNSSVTDNQTLTDPAVTSSDKPLLIKDSNGTVFSVDENNVAHQVGHYDDSFKDADKLVESEDFELEFKENKEATYYFDKYQEAYGKSAAMASHYLPNTSAKAIVPGALDLVDYEITKGSIDKDKLTFVNTEGLVFDKLDRNTIQLAGGPAKDAQIVFAVYEVDGKKVTIGKLLLSSYTPQVKKVVIIPVKSSKTFDKDVAKIQRALNAVYEGVGVTYEVTIDRSFEMIFRGVAVPNCSFKPEGSGLLSNDYTGDEKAVRDAYIAANSATLDPEAAYIFAVGNPIVQTGDENLQGKMNFGKQFGFLYSVNTLSESTLGNTLAHELGHGNYKFYHIFDKEYLRSAAKGNTNNIMDYSTSTHLNKLQWDIIAQPGVTWGLFDKDKDQELSVTDDLALLSKGVFPDHEGFFMSFSGNPIFLPNGFRIAAAIHNGPVIAFEIPDGHGGYKFYSEYWLSGKFDGYRGLDDNYNSSVQYSGQDINFFTNILEVNDATNNTKVKHPVIAMFFGSRINSAGNEYLYKIGGTQNINTGGKTEDYERIVLKNPISEFYVLSKGLKDISSGSDKSKSNRIDKFIGGTFSDENPEYKTFNYNGGNYTGFATGVYNKYLQGDPTQAPSSSIYIEYDGHKYYDNEPIYIPEAEQNKSSSNYVFKVGGNTVPVSTYFATPNSNGSYEALTTTQQNTNPFTISNIIGAKRYRVDVDDPSVSGPEYTNFIIGADLFITYLGNKEADPSVTATTPLPRVSGQYQTSISYGDNLFLKYRTSIPALSALDTEVLIFSEHMDGTNRELLATIGSGTNNSFNTISPIGNESSTVVQDFIVTVVLRKKKGNVVLCTKKIKVSVMPRETLQEIIIEDKTNFTKYDSYTNLSDLRKAEGVNPMFLVTTPSLSNDGKIKTLNFKLKTSNNNKYNSPVLWEFKEGFGSQNIKISPKTSSVISETLETKLQSNYSIVQDELLFKKKFKGVTIDTKNILNANEFLNLKQESFIVRSSAFGSFLTKEVYIIKNPDLSFELDFSALKYEGSPTSFSEFIGVTKKIGETIETAVKTTEDVINKNPILGQDKSGFKFKAGFLKPSFKYYVKEQASTPYCLEMIDPKLKYADFSWEYTKSVDVLSFASKLNPVLSAMQKLDELIDEVAIYAKVDLTIGIGLDLSATFPYERLIDGGVNDFTEGNQKFTLTPNLKFSGKPVIGVQGLNYSAEGSFVVGTGFRFPMSYDPSNAVLTLDDGYLDPVKIKDFKFEVFKTVNGEKVVLSNTELSVDFSFLDEGLKIYNKTTYDFKD